jgi:monoamine oxidase
MVKKDIVIIGSGAAGIAAAYQLMKSGVKVTVVEARDRPGGRINTIIPESFSIPIEAGAEFIHGSLPLTLSLIKEAGLSTLSMEGKTYRIKDGKVNNSEEFFCFYKTSCYIPSSYGLTNIFQEAENYGKRK